MLVYSYLGYSETLEDCRPDSHQIRIVHCSTLETLGQQESHLGLLVVVQDHLRHFILEAGVKNAHSLVASVLHCFDQVVETHDWSHELCIVIDNIITQRLSWPSFNPLPV